MKGNYENMFNNIKDYNLVK